MENTTKKIENIEELRNRLLILEKIKDQQEVVLIQNFKEVYASLQPKELLNNAIELINEEEVNMRKFTNYGINYLAKKYLSSQKTPKGMIKGIVSTELIHLTYNRFQQQIHNAVKEVGKKIADLITPKSVNNK